MNRCVKLGHRHRWVDINFDKIYETIPPSKITKAEQCLNCDIKRVLNSENKWEYINETDNH